MGRPKPKDGNHLVGWGGGAGPESDIWGETGSLPGLWWVRRSTSLRKVAWSAVLSGISRSLSSCPRQLCSRHSTMSLEGQDPSAKGTPSGSAGHTLRSAPTACCCPVPQPSPDRHGPSCSSQAFSGLHHSSVGSQTPLFSMLQSTQACRPSRCRVSGYKVHLPLESRRKNIWSCWH